MDLKGFQGFMGFKGFHGLNGFSRISRVSGFKGFCSSLENVGAWLCSLLQRGGVRVFRDFLTCLTGNPLCWHSNLHRALLPATFWFQEKTVAKVNESAAKWTR